MLDAGGDDLAEERRHLPRGGGRRDVEVVRGAGPAEEDVAHRAAHDPRAVPGVAEGVEDLQDRRRQLRAGADEGGGDGHQ
jgi:hypothetical protein